MIVPITMAHLPKQAHSARLERVAQPLVLAAVVVGVYGVEGALPLAFLPMPVLVWGAARFGVRVATVQLLASGIAMSLLTTEGRGPFPSVVGRWDFPPRWSGRCCRRCWWPRLWSPSGGPADRRARRVAGPGPRDRGDA